MKPKFLFLIPLVIGFVFNWASAFTHFYSRRWGGRRGRLVTFVARNILGIPVWAVGVFLASREPSPLFFTPSPVIKILAWILLSTGTFLMIWALALLRLRSFRPTEKDTLVAGGLFKYIRHPIYSGLLWDFIALVLMRPTVPVILACALGWVFVFVQARLEEMDRVERIPAYREYTTQVPRVFPRRRKKG
jgi:protein-S-isoprenylcysteine O-methyltransferase Ste14